MWITKLRKVIQEQTQLFTLKRTRKMMKFTLIDSCFSAETLPRSIYTCNYIYKKTNSWLGKSVDKKGIEINKIIYLAVLLTMLSGCQKEIYVPITASQKLYVNERLETKAHPAEFYLCGSCKYPCREETNKWSGIKTIKKTAKRNKKNVRKDHQSSFFTNKSMERKNERNYSKNICDVK